jgi:hypothetical protein
MVFIESTAKEQKVLPSTSGFVRYLGAFEHLHWLFSRSGPRAFAFAIEVTGTTTVDQWAYCSRCTAAKPATFLRSDRH